MKTTLLAAFLFTMSSASAATGAEFTLQIEKPAHLNIRSIRVEGGEVSGLQEGHEPEKFSVTVRLPDGVCSARVTLFYNQASDLRTDSNINFCSVRGIKVSRSRY